MRKISSISPMSGRGEGFREGVSRQQGAPTNRLTHRPLPPRYPAWRSVGPFPPSDRPCVVHHGSILPLDSHSSQPRLAPLDSTRRPQSSRSPSLLLADVRVLFVNHGGTGTACSKRWRADVRPAWERPEQAHPIGGKAAAKTYRVPTPHGFGQTSVPLFVSGRAALLVPSSGTRFRVPPSRGAPARAGDDRGTLPCIARFFRRGLV